MIQPSLAWWIASIYWRNQVKRRMDRESAKASLIAERVARRVSGARGNGSGENIQAGAPVREELAAIRSGLRDLEKQLDRIESSVVGSGTTQPTEQTRARLIDFVPPPPPVGTSVSSFRSAVPQSQPTQSASSGSVPATHSPWLGTGYSPTAAAQATLPTHPSQERFGVEEATVAELVEFFENEKKCSVEPGGKPCDHCAMCSSRGF